MATKRRRNSITRLIEDVVDDAKDLVDDVVDRAKDVERDGRKAVRRAVNDNGDDGKDHSAREMDDLKSALDDLTAKVNRLVALGVPLEFALYVLPNAKTLRLVESGQFIALLHKWTLRTCFNAQEEIYLASMDRAWRAKERLLRSNSPLSAWTPDTVPRALARAMGSPAASRAGSTSSVTRSPSASRPTMVSRCP